MIVTRKACDKYTAAMVDSLHASHVILQISTKAFFLAETCP